MLRTFRHPVRIVIEAYRDFLADDGWAIASHIALSALMALFPFLILVTALGATLFGSRNLADEVATLLLEAWPPQVSGPIETEIHNVLTQARGDILTIGAVLSLYFASSGIESLRIGLNRAYDMVEARNWLLLRLESIAYVLIAALALLALSFLVVLGPLIFATATRYAPGLAPLEWNFTVARYTVASLILIVALVIAHKWLPAGRRSFGEILVGIVVTLILWLAAGFGFARYLANFSSSYVSYYAGLASVMIALVFLYWTACIFIFGGELNAVIARLRREPDADESAGRK
ncbi:MAG TPA: YihY/virulence factor BrkB family protein [Xanthobacteraceae bacterium]